MKFIQDLLLKHQITEYGIIDLEKLSVINPRLLPDKKIQSVLVTLLPYRTGNIIIKDNYNMGLFARTRDYHSVYADIAKSVIPELTNSYGGEVFFFADHSPINEKDAATKCGLGFIGRNSLLINQKYGSFVFIGCFLFTEKLEEVIRNGKKGCGDCKRCENACPTGAISYGIVNLERCLSGISQKKKKTEEELSLLQDTKTVWGCDICQNACPYNKKALKSCIIEFDKDSLGNISAEIINSMEEDVYKQYAFSYRPKKVIVENFLTADGKRDIINQA